MEAAALPTAAGRPVVRRVTGHVSDEDLVALVRAGDDGAFELLYDRHHRGLLAFCRHMLGSIEEAEDALQHSMLSAYRAMRGDDRELRVKPWLYAIARNRCLSVLRARRDERPIEHDLTGTDGLAAAVDRREELRRLLADLAALPEDQRAALVLFELGDHAQDDIADVLGVRREKVKALVFQARENLLAARRARATPCEQIRAELAVATGAALRRAPLRRHVDDCPACAAFESDVRRQRAALAVVLPVVPAAGLKDAVLGALGIHASGAAATAAAGGAGAGGAAASGSGFAGAGAGAAGAGGAGLAAAAGGVASGTAGAGLAASGSGSALGALAALAAKGVAAKLAVAAAVAVTAGAGGYVAVEQLHPAELGAPHTSRGATPAMPATSAGPGGATPATPATPASPSNALEHRRGAGAPGRERAGAGDRSSSAKAAGRRDRAPAAAGHPKRGGHGVARRRQTSDNAAAVGGGRGKGAEKARRPAPGKKAPSAGTRNPAATAPRGPGTAPVPAQKSAPATTKPSTTKPSTTKAAETPSPPTTTATPGAVAPSGSPAAAPATKAPKAASTTTADGATTAAGTDTTTGG